MADLSVIPQLTLCDITEEYLGTSDRIIRRIQITGLFCFRKILQERVKTCGMLAHDQ